jgi:hypothetical protein
MDQRLVMLAHGFTIEQLVELVRAGLATATAQRVRADGQRSKWQPCGLPDAGRRALAKAKP